MNPKISQTEMDDSELPIKALLSKMNTDVINDGFEESLAIEAISKEEKQGHVKDDDKKNMLNWNSLSDAEEAEDCTATITVPFFAETVSQNEEFIKSQEAFQEAFPVGKLLSTKILQRLISKN